MDINYRGVKPYKTAKFPIRQPLYLTALIRLLSRICLANKIYRVEKQGMEGLKPPYLLLSNHMSFIDFELIAMGTGMQRVNNVVNIDGYYRRPWLLEWIGAICTRKFTTDLHLVKSIQKVLSRGDVLCMYPEARYSPCGVTSYLPDSLGMLIRRCRVPVVVAIHRGNHLHAPAWGIRRKRRVPLRTTMQLLITAEETEALSVEQINERLRHAFIYDDYRYQEEEGFLITEKNRAEGLHKVLYQCPHCMTEFKMDSVGTELFCTACEKRWNLEENGRLRATCGETEFPHIPDWFAWERKNVAAEIDRGDYSFTDEVEVYSMPACWRFEPLGRAMLTHDAEQGLVLTGVYRDQEYRIERQPLQTNSLHIEYDFPHIKPFDCVDISTENDSFYCFPTKQNVATKLGFAVEEIYLRHLARVRRPRRRPKND